MITVRPIMLVIGGACWDATRHGEKWPLYPGSGVDALVVFALVFLACSVSITLGSRR